LVWEMEIVTETPRSTLERPVAGICTFAFTAQCCFKRWGCNLRELGKQYDGKTDKCTQYVKLQKRNSEERQDYKR
jgi:hypothetical protein